LLTLPWLAIAQASKKDTNKATGDTAAIADAASKVAAAAAAAAGMAAAKLKEVDTQKMQDGAKVVADQTLVIAGAAATGTKEGAKDLNQGALLLLLFAAAAARRRCPACPSALPGAAAASARRRLCPPLPLPADADGWLPNVTAGVDTMMYTLIDKAALVSKHWRLRTESKEEFFLTLRHYSMTKMKILTISGLQVLVNNRVVFQFNELVEGTKEIPFSLGGKTGTIKVEADQAVKDKYTYSLTWGGPTRVSDIMASKDEDPYATLGAGTFVSHGELVEHSGSKYVVYEVSCKPTPASDELKARKRYKEFDTLQRLVKSAYSDNPSLLAKLPKLPGKTYLGRKTSPEFIQKRQTMLEQYMRSMLAVEKATCNPDVLAFLGLLDAAGKKGAAEAAPSGGAAAGGGGGGAAAAEIYGDSDEEADDGAAKTAAKEEKAEEKKVEAAAEGAEEL